MKIQYKTLSQIELDLSEMKDAFLDLCAKRGHKISSEVTCSFNYDDAGFVESVLIEIKEPKP